MPAPHLQELLSAFVVYIRFYLFMEPNERFGSSFLVVMLPGFFLVETFTGRSLFCNGSVTGRFTCGIVFVTLLPGTTFGEVGYLA